MNRIRLDGLSDVRDFLNIVNGLDGRIELCNLPKNYRINAKSQLGVLMASSEWGDNIWIDSDKDIYSKIERFIVIADDDNATIHN